MRKQISSTKKPGSGMYAGSDKPAKPTRPAAPSSSKKKPA